MEAINTVIPQSTPKVVIIKPGVFNGSLSRFQATAYRDLVYGGLSKAIAHKVAHDFGSDLGRLMATDEDFSAKVGKANKDGDSVIRLSGKGKIQNTRSMATVRLTQQIDAFYQEGLIEDRNLPKLSENLRDYITDCETWVKAQEWAK